MVSGGPTVAIAESAERSGDSGWSSVGGGLSAGNPSTDAERAVIEHLTR